MIYKTPKDLESNNIVDEQWFKKLPVSERIIWLRIVRNQMIENLESASKIIYIPSRK